MNDVFDDRLRDLTVVHRSPITVGSLIFVAVAFAIFVIVGAASVPAAGIAVVLIAVLWVTVAPIAAVAGAHIVLVAAVAPVFTAPLAIAAFVFFELACVILLAASAGKLRWAACRVDRWRHRCPCGGYLGDAHAH